nr:protein MEI2-like 4 isoform X1 [Ipomoea batatas]
MISYYDIRAALNAMKALQNKPLRHRKLDIHFSIPKDYPPEKDVNQGTLAVFNLEPSVSNDEIRRIFCVYGEIKEIRETPNKSLHKLIEFYDSRAAEAALHALNGSYIAGKQIKLEPSHPAGARQLQPFSPEMERDESGLYLQQNGYPSSLTTAYPGAMATNINAWTSEVIDKQQFCRVGSNGHSIGLNDGVFGPTGNGSCTPSGRSYAWSTSPRHQPQGMIWPNSPSLVSGVCTALPQQMHAVSDAPNHMLNTLLPINNHHVGSTPSVNSSIWDRRHAYTGESPEVSVFHPGSLGSVQISGNSPHPLEFLPHNMFPRAGGNGMDSPVTSKSVGLPSPHQRCLMFPPRGQIISMMNSFDSPNERTRSRRNEGSSNQTDNKKQFELDIDRIVRGDDKRTTLMIKNIPNKYTSKMLLAAIDEHHKGTYDFIYLPIDFKNKCNVGYAFINMTDPSFIIPFYHALNGKKWEKFNSEKVASLAYARIQGKAALIAHFQNSSLMNEDKRCRPILFHTDGPNAGDQVPFPMGVNVRSRPNKSRGSTGEENNHEIHVSLSNGESSSHGESCGVVKDSN